MVPVQTQLFLLEIVLHARVLIVIFEIVVVDVELHRLVEVAIVADHETLMFVEVRAALSHR